MDCRKNDIWRIEPRETCYVSKSGLPAYKYSGYEPVIHSWDDFPPLKDILQVVHEALPGSNFNSLLLNRYKHSGDHTVEQNLDGLLVDVFVS